jgi:HK97 family phage prohead protease
VPDNWADDGSLKDGRAWTAEQRDTANDVFAALRAAVEDAYGDQFDRYWIWVQDWYGAGTDEDPYMVVFMAGDSLYAAAVQLRRRAEGRARRRGEGAAGHELRRAVEQRNVSHLLEWRKKKARARRPRAARVLVSRLELREKDDDTWNLTGYASVTETPYEVGFYTETIKRGAFKRTLGENPDVQLLVNHEGLPLARTRSGTLRLEERRRQARPLGRRRPRQARPGRAAARAQDARGDIDQMSFAFQVTDQDWNDDFTERDDQELSIHRGDVSSSTRARTRRGRVDPLAEAIEALRARPEAFIAAWAEWRDHTLLPLEQRAGKALSSATMEVLSQVLNLVAAADDAVDEAQPLLADLMGVPNPDADDAPTRATGRRRDGRRARAVIPTTRRGRGSSSRCSRGGRPDEAPHPRAAHLQRAQPRTATSSTASRPSARRQRGARSGSSATRARWTPSSSAATQAAERELRAAQEPGGPLEGVEFRANPNRTRAGRLLRPAAVADRPLRDPAARRSACSPR